MPSIEALVSLSNVLHVDPAEVLERVRLRAEGDSTAACDLQELGQRAERLLWAGDHRGALGAYDALLGRLAAAPPATDDDARHMAARIELKRAVACRECRAWQASEASAKRAIALARNVSAIQSEAFMVLASLYAQQDSLELAELTARRGIALSQDSDPGLQGLAWMQLGQVLVRAERFEEARTAYLEARRFAIQARDPLNRVRIEGAVGSCLFALGRHAQAEKRFRTAVDLARKYDDPAAEARWLIELGRLALLAGRLDEADRLAVASLRLSKAAGRALAIFLGEWLRHQIAGRRPAQPADRHRVAFLKRLYFRVQEHTGIDGVREFRETFLPTKSPREESIPRAPVSAAPARGSVGRTARGALR